MDQKPNPIAAAAAQAAKPTENLMQAHGERLNAIANSDASVSKKVEMLEAAHAEGYYVVDCVGPKAGFEDAYVKLRDEMLIFEEAGNMIEVIRLKALMAPMEEKKWHDVIENLVVTVGKNLALDTFLAGSSYTVTGPFLGLVGASPTPNAADTMASHGGWTEVGGTNAPQYTAPRKTAAFSAASAGAKSLSSNLVFAIITTGGTVGGCFLVFGSGAVNTIDSTAGVLYSVGAFTGGNKVVGVGDTLTVSYSATL